MYSNGYLQGFEMLLTFFGLLILFHILGKLGMFSKTKSKNLVCISAVFGIVSTNSDSTKISKKLEKSFPKFSKNCKVAFCL